MATRLFAFAALVVVAAGAAIDPCSAQEPGTLLGRFRSGRFEAVFETPGRYRFLANGQMGLMGALLIRGDTLTLTDDGGPAACVGVPGRHRFSLAGDTLRFTPISDDCQGRRNALAQAWIRDRASEFALTNLTVIDGTGAPPRPGMTVLVKEGTIVGLFPTGSEAIPATATVSDLSGRFVIPGLVDSHVHLATDPSTGDRRALVEQRLRHALRGGITVVRDMAGDGRALADLARAALVGDIESPAIFYSALMSGPPFFEDPRVRSSSRGVTVGSAPSPPKATGPWRWRKRAAPAPRGSSSTPNCPASCSRRSRRKLTARE